MIRDVYSFQILSYLKRGIGLSVTKLCSDLLRKRGVKGPCLVLAERRGEVISQIALGYVLVSVGAVGRLSYLPERNRILVSHDKTDALY